MPVLIAAAVLLLIFAVGLWIVCYLTFYNNRRMDGPGVNPNSINSFAPYMGRVNELIAELKATPCEDVECMSYDELRLTGRYYHISDEAPLDIMVHGYKSNSTLDFCGGFRLARELKHNVLLIDQRSCRESEGRFACFGIKERHDLMSWITYALCRFGEDKEINLFGVSMGAATVLMVNDLGLPENVKHIIADSPYDSPRDIIMKVAGDMGVPQWFWPIIRLSARVFCRMNIEESRAEDAVKLCRVPVLIFHGEADRLIPCSMSRELIELCPEGSRLVTIEGADHVAGMLKDPEKYEKAVREYLG